MNNNQKDDYKKWTTEDTKPLWCIIQEKLLHNQEMMLDDIYQNIARYKVSYTRNIPIVCSGTPMSYHPDIIPTFLEIEYISFDDYIPNNTQSIKQQKTTRQYKKQIRMKRR